MINTFIKTLKTRTKKQKGWGLGEKQGKWWDSDPRTVLGKPTSFLVCFSCNSPVTPTTGHL